MNELRDSTCGDQSKQKLQSSIVPRATPDLNQGDLLLGVIGIKLNSTHGSSFRQSLFTLYANNDGLFAPPASNDQSAYPTTAWGVDPRSSSEESQLKFVVSLLQPPSNLTFEFRTSYKTISVQYSYFSFNDFQFIILLLIFKIKD
ncbi:hypothetical protein DFH28DRAFT_308841 [Melampsora americana]|nr:hypothetical protein DFH28DRAFT_308841 [Melampsora americana]